MDLRDSLGLEKRGVRQLWYVMEAGRQVAFLMMDETLRRDRRMLH